jgi:hypothetical protein
LATFVDYLVTVFSTQGAAQTAAAFNLQGANAVRMARQLDDAASSVLGLAASMSGLGQAMYPVFFAFYRAPVAVKFIAAEILALVGIVKAATSAFMELEQQQFRFQLAFAHAGLGGSVGQFSNFARQNRARTGIGEDETLGLAAELSTLRFNQQQITALIPALQGASLAGLGKPAQIASNIAKASVGGETQALVDMGLDVNKIKRSSDRASEIIRQVVEKFGKDAELQLSTLGGQMNALGSDWKAAMAELGDLLAPALRLVILVIRHFVQGLQLAFIIAKELVKQLTFGLYTPQSEQTSEAIKRAGINRERADSDNLKKIEQNTREIQTTLARETLGAAGAAVRNAATIRNFRTAVGARG